LQPGLGINMIIGMSTACFYPTLYVENAAQKMGEMNIPDIEVFFSTLSEYKPDFVKELKKKVDEHNTNVFSVHALSLQFEPQLFSSHARSRQDSLDIYEQVLEAGAVLGAKVYVMHGPAHVKRACALNLNYEYIAEYTDPLADMAKQYGIKLSWENVHWCWYANPDFPEKLNPLLSSDNLYYTLDIKQAAQAGFSPSEFIKQMGQRLVNVHVCDYSISDNKGVVPKLPFLGDMDFDVFRAALKDAEYDGPIMLEVYNSNYSDYSELLDSYNRVKKFFVG